MTVYFASINVSKCIFSPAPLTPHPKKNKPMVIRALANPHRPWVLSAIQFLYGSPRREKRLHLKIEKLPEYGTGAELECGNVRTGGTDRWAYV